MGKMRVITDIASRGMDHLHDASKVIVASPEDVEAVYFPENIGDLTKIVTEAHNRGIPIRVQGARSGLTSGCVPRMGNDSQKERVISLDNYLEVSRFPSGFKRGKFTSTAYGLEREIIYAITGDGSEIILPAGATLKERGEILDNFWRTFPITPTYMDATVGGSMKTNGTGLQGAFGSTRDWVTRSLQVLGDGKEVDMVRSPAQEKSAYYVVRSSCSGKLKVPLPTYPWNPIKNASGIFTGRGSYPLDIFIGDEGALGICAEVGFRTLERRVDIGFDIVTGLAFFTNEEEALRFVLEARELYGLKEGTKLTSLNGDGIGICGIDWMGGGGIKLVKGKLKLPDNTSAILEIAYGANDSQTLDNLLGLMGKYGVAESSWFDEGRTADMKALREAIPLAINERVLRKVGTDAAVPLDKLIEAHRDFNAVIAEYAKWCEGQGIPGPYQAHIGHPYEGHMHYNIILPKEHYSDKGYARARGVQSQIIQWAINNGGVPSAEHGIGSKTALIGGIEIPLLELAYGPRAIHEITAMKKTLGSENLNRGVLVPLNHA